MSAVEQRPAGKPLDSSRGTAGAALHRIRAGLRRVPRAAWICALVAVLNSAAWAVLLPPLQAHDEHSHVYYAQYLASTGKVPRPVSITPSRSPEQLALETYIGLNDVTGNVFGRPPWTNAQRRDLDRALGAGLSPRGRGGDEAVGNYPPLYYATVDAGYAVASSGNLVKRITAMRLVSALFAGVTVLFTYLFLRELFPRERWLWTVGALLIALQPVFAFIAGAVNPDGGLAAAAAAMFYLLARGFRRGLTIRSAATLGLVLAIGVLMKVTMIAFIPGVALAALLLARRAHREGGESALALLGAGTLAFLIPMGIYVGLNLTVWDRPLLPSGGGGGVGNGATGSTSGLLSYAWQDYLPRLWFMRDWFGGDYNGWETWFKTFWGVFGWGDFNFTLRVFQWLVVAMSAVVVGATVAVVRARRRLWARRGEVGTYLVLALGLLALLAYVGYGYRVSTGYKFEQGRYLFPLLAPFAALVALALSSLGQRFGRLAGVLVVVLMFGLTFYAHLLTVARFYA